MKILVADDDTFFLKAVSEILNEAGHDVILAQTGDEALKKALTESPDLIVLDIVLPNLLGTEVSVKLKLLNRTSKVPILLVSSGNWGPETFLADDFLRKPFQPDELLEKIESLTNDG